MDDIIRMARESGLVMYDYSDPSLVRFANLVAAAEHTAVLQAIEAVYMLEEGRNSMFSDGYKYALDQIETLIKARGQR
jgi:hypothetical protein